MERKKLLSLLERVKDNTCSPTEALEALAQLPFSNLGIARVDHHRELRCGFAEVIFGGGKTAGDIIHILQHSLKRTPCVLVTRVTPEQAAAIKKKFRKAEYNPRGRTLLAGKPVPLKTNAVIAVVAAGTSDIPVAEEALDTLRAFGCPAKKIYDVGVAGLHRLLDVMPDLRSATAVIAIAGMEGAMPSVVGGLVSCPVIAVPTSIGYGASFNGVAALLGMLNSCASGVSVVNIDNGFGAAMSALRIVSRVSPK